jgi:hypothetical protein
MLILGFFMSANVFAQGIDTAHKDTSKRFMIVDARPIDKHTKPFCVVDGKIYKRSIKHINPKDILEVSILKDSALDRTSSAGFHGPAILITTKLYAISQYQKKLSAFSKEYSDYLDKHKGDDSEVIFLVDGEQLTGYSDRIIKLFKLPIDKIKSAEFSTKSIDIRDQAPALIIATKQ